MGTVQTTIVEDDVPSFTPVELVDNAPEIPMVKAQIKHVVLYNIDKMTIHYSNHVLTFLMDFAFEGELTVKGKSVNKEEGDKEGMIEIEKKSFMAGMKQMYSVNIPDGVVVVDIDVCRPQGVELPLTEYLLIDHVTSEISLLEMAKMTKMNFQYGDVWYNAFDVFGVGEEKGGEDLCAVCMCEPREILLLPCRHVAMCAECYNEVKERTRQCPVCRGTITAAINFSRKPEKKEVAIDMENPHLN
ncbi:hypothetical protein EIN_185370 [Entamoeba invadens IP1]|uniref:hypothetical protein n=1 Tax=Entamoeba invadens IP1 TaxID=370355 RepID=UPI0002C3FA24|nr:hypothetical protein EIN_185370 [Entamoeba invadens IP1]ELP94150.1 hypothetical protein EIN_185370 [Entamoeba invadens IP1]|eukprot:XP_004260921.1 hypothetical protein EIN_185370 [Entamoeba invadens IP1]